MLICNISSVFRVHNVGIHPEITKQLFNFNPKLRLLCAGYYMLYITHAVYNIISIMEAKQQKYQVKGIGTYRTQYEITKYSVRSCSFSVLMWITLNRRVQERENTHHCALKRALKQTWLLQRGPSLAQQLRYGRCCQANINTSDINKRHVWCETSFYSHFTFCTDCVKY